MQLIHFIKVTCSALAFFTVSACGYDINDDYQPDLSQMIPNAIVTVKTDPQSNQMYLQLNDSTTLLPVNMTKSPFGKKQVRALANISDALGSNGAYSRLVTINRIDSIVTKPTVPSTGSQDYFLFGNDAVEIIDNWMTGVEDGYLTICFSTIWGDAKQPHIMNLLTGTDPTSLYTVELHHNAQGDKDGNYANSIIAFDLKSLPPTFGKTVKLKLVWESFFGRKSMTFDYKSPQNHNTSEPHPDI